MAPPAGIEREKEREEGDESICVCVDLEGAYRRLHVPLEKKRGLGQISSNTQTQLPGPRCCHVTADVCQ